MKRIAVAALLFIAFFSASCDTTDTLLHVCPNPEPCAVIDGAVITDGLQGIMLKGECKFGLTECDDNNVVTSCIGFVNASIEICNGLDDNCDGSIDELFDEDADGYMSCGGDCNDRDPSVNPSMQEECDKLDNDCNGTVDEFTEQCWTGPSYIKDRLNDTMTCRLGLSLCHDGLWKPCEGQVLPNREICDRLDNDCDGSIDEAINDSCGASNTGICHMGNLICTNDGEQICVDAVHPVPEICNGLDDDCNGQTDEDLSRLCETACGRGIELCDSGLWQYCDAPQPTNELCDRLDNDCDGETDEGCPCIVDDVMVCRQGMINRTTMEPVMCGIGITFCTTLGQWGPCYFYGTEPEACDAWDNDCDGHIDGIMSSCGDQQTAGIGECRLGSSTCEDGAWGICEGAVAPINETCNDLDDDCDGLVDEDLNPHDKVDLCFFIDGSGSMCNSMEALADGISNYVADFQGTKHRFCLGVFPGREPGSSSGMPVIMLTGTPGNAMVDISEMQYVLTQLTCTYGGWEPNYDAMYLAADNSDPLGIGWRTIEPAYPYIIIITDETAQWWLNITETDVASHTKSCNVGACAPGDMFETYVITNNTYWELWDEPTFHDANRLIDIAPVNSARYTMVLRNIFTNVCL